MKPKKFKLGPMQRKLLQALKSKKYKHATGALCRMDNKGNVVGNCCLGVAAEVCGMKRRKDAFGTVFYGNGSVYAPKKVVHSLALYGSHGPLLNDPNRRTLAIINDEAKSFAPIIKLIETKPESIFKSPR
jgi:hypothetical protein